MPTSLSLSLCLSLLLLGIIFCECSDAAGLQILQSPVSQTTTLGQSATFHCSASADGQGSFDLVFYSPNKPKPIYITSETISLPDWLSRSIHDSYDPQSFSETFTANATIYASLATNGTKFRCRIFQFGAMDVFSETAELIVIGPPATPSELSIPRDLVNMELQQFSVVWNVPFTHTNHSISHYNVTVSNNQSQSYEMSILADPKTSESVVQVTLFFPPNTTSCEILSISVTAVNDIGPSIPASADMTVMKVPYGELTATTELKHQTGSQVTFVTEIMFPVFCWFERVNYSVFLEEVSDEGRQVTQLDKSVQNPQEPVTETISAGAVANANYSVVVCAWTQSWNSSTPPHSFSLPSIPTSAATQEISTGSPEVGAVSPGSEESGPSRVLVGVVAGSVGFLLILIAAIITIICILYSRNGRANPMNIEDMKVSSISHDLTTNPIYDGHLYETVKDPAPKPLSLKQELQHPLPPNTAGSLYSESPTLSKQRQISGVEEMEDTYVQMHTCKRK